MLFTDTILDILDTEPPISGDFNDVQGVATLQELVYFGAGWLGLDMFGYGIEQRDGWQNAQVHRTDTAEYSLTGGFYAGQVEHVDADGKVTDVVLSFQGMQIDAEVAAAVPSVILGLPSDFFQRGVDLFEAILHDPRYEHAKIHITGYSMGTTIAARIMAYSIKTYGETVTDQRVDFTSFAPARYHDQQAAYYGLGADIFEGRWTNYQAANDENRDPNHAIAGVPYDYLGTEVILPTLATPNGHADVHQWDFLTVALGLPDWLTEDEKQFVYANAGTTSAVGYTDPGKAQLRIEGDDAGTWLTGLGANDLIIGGLGQDVMTGNGGNDLFAFETIWDSGQTRATADLITDFSEGDRIDLSAIDAVQSGLNWQGTNEQFHLISGNQFTGAGQIMVQKTSEATYVLVNTDSDTLPEMVIELAGRHVLGAEDFIF